MTGQEARRFASRAHGDALDRYGVRLLDHVRRVAAVVPADARTVAWLHEILECTSIDARQLKTAGVSETEIAAVELLTRDPDASAAAYAAHVERIAEAGGPAGRLARIVKRADLEDRIRHDDAGPASGHARPAYRDALARLAARPAGVISDPRASQQVPADIPVGGRPWSSVWKA